MAKRKILDKSLTKIHSYAMIGGSQNARVLATNIEAKTRAFWRLKNIGESADFLTFFFDAFWLPTAS